MIMKIAMKKYLIILAFLYNNNLAATEWSSLNKEKSQTLDQHCTVISIKAEIIMEARQVGIPLDEILDIDKSPIGKEIAMSAFDWAKMTTRENQISAINEFKSQWMLKCLKEHPANNQ